MLKITKLIIATLVILNIVSGFVLSQYETKLETQSVVLGASSTPVFSPNYVMNDSTFINRNIFPSSQSIQNYLSKINSPLANFQENGRTASSIIFDASNGTSNTHKGVKPNINPAVILAFLEKEQSLLSIKKYDTNRDPEVRMKWAMGMGCPDTSKCDPDYAGFTNQVKWGAFQLQLNFDRSKQSNSDQYQVGNTITTQDGYQVNLSNSATASAYRYTPHVYWGNYSLWKILTANGWGTSSQTYSYSELDSVNLQNKNKPVVYNPNPNQSDAINLNLKMEATVGQKTQPNNQLSIPKITTGNINTMTWSGNNTSQDNSSCENLKKQKWQEGEKSERVRQLQLCMQKNGYFVWIYGATGYFGPVTKQALINWRGYF
jgi:hypothetical protein